MVGEYVMALMPGECCRPMRRDAEDLVARFTRLHDRTTVDVGHGMSTAKYSAPRFARDFRQEHRA